MFSIQALQKNQSRLLQTVLYKTEIDQPLILPTMTNYLWIKLSLNIALVEEDLRIGRAVHRPSHVRVSVLLQYLSEHNTTMQYKTRKLKAKLAL